MKKYLRDNDLTETDMEDLFHTFGSPDRSIVNEYFDYYLDFCSGKLYLYLAVAFSVKTKYDEDGYYSKYQRKIPLDDEAFSNCENALTDLLIDAQNELSECENIFYNVRTSLKSYK